MTALSTRLARAGLPSPEVDARALLMHALGLSWAGLLTRSAPLNADEAARIEALLRRREAREPLQHLLGELDWGGVRLRCDTRALIPRPETEGLLTWALEALPPAARVLDVGTGSGALALGLKAARPDLTVTASDLSAEALGLAAENARHNSLNVTLVRADLLEGLPGPYELIVSNPPYLPETDAGDLQPEVRHDPPLALYGGPDGLGVARRLAGQARERLGPGGQLRLELDPRNAEAMAAELRAAGWADAEVRADLSGRPRFVGARRAD